MDTATRILNVGGMVVLTYGLLLGIPMIVARRNAPRAPRYLVEVHVSAIIEGTLLLVLPGPMLFATLSPVLQTLAASLILGGVVLFVLGDTLNWLQGLEDAFQGRPFGQRVLAAGTPVILAGAAVLLVGVVRAA